MKVEVQEPVSPVSFTPVNVLSISCRAAMQVGFRKGQQGSVSPFWNLKTKPTKQKYPNQLTKKTQMNKQKTRYYYTIFLRCVSRRYIYTHTYINVHIYFIPLKYTASYLYRGTKREPLYP